MSMAIAMSGIAVALRVTVFVAGTKVLLLFLAGATG